VCVWVCPQIAHWQREFNNWTDLNVITYQGNATAREVCRRYEYFFLDNQGQRKNLVCDLSGCVHALTAHTQFMRFHVLLTTYEMLTNDDWGELQGLHWSFVVVDEVGDACWGVLVGDVRVGPAHQECVEQVVAESRDILDAASCVVDRHAATG
jgi:hypothetical protein